MRDGASLSAVLGRFYASVRQSDLPAETVHAVRRHLLDTLGAALAGAGQPEPRAAFEAGRHVFGEGGIALIWGSRRTGPPALAALVNGTAAHALELDDAMGCDHSGAVVIPAVFAALPLAGALSDDDLISAIAVGYDLGRRVMDAAGGYDAHNGRGWHSTGTCGVFGAAAAVARLLRCDAGTFERALGIAGSFSAGNWSFIEDGAMTKRLHPAGAAACGVLAVSLARADMTGPSRVFEASWGGFFSTYAPETSDPAELTQGLGEPWRIHRSAIKPYASCRGTHAAIEAMLAFRAQGASVETVETIEARVDPILVRMCGATQVTTLLDAQMSLPYSVAVALVHGAADLPMFADAVRGDPTVLGWASRVRVVESTTPMSNVAVELAVGLKDGRSLRTRIDDPDGSETRPLPDSAVRAKFRSLAEPVLGGPSVHALEAAVWALGIGGAATVIERALRGRDDSGLHGRRI